MSKQLFIDAHHHLWDLAALRYPWLTDAVRPRRFGDYSAICRNYLVPDLLRDARDCGLVKSIHVQANAAGDPVRETEWLQRQADAHGFPHAIVATADLTDPDVERTLAAHCEHANMRGIRVLLHWLGDENYDGPLQPHLMTEPAFRRGYALLEQYGLSFDLPLHHPQTDEALGLLAAFPGVPAVLNHCGFPVHLERCGREREEAWQGWRDAIARLARMENLYCKLSGLWMAGRALGAEDIRPVVEHCLESFGTGRCMVGSNFPIDGLWVRYPEMLDAYTACFEGLGMHERRALCHDNAARFYRI